MRSFSTYMDVETCRDMVQHPLCAPNTTEGLVSAALSKLKGRLLPEEDSAVLEQVLRVTDGTDRSIKIYNVSRMTDNLAAIGRGVRKTPAMVIDGKKYQGLKAILEALSANK